MFLLCPLYLSMFFIGSYRVRCLIHETESDFFKDKFFKKEILSLEFYCPYYESCNWHGSLKDLKKVSINFLFSMALFVHYLSCI